jgi:hypothetical protein
LNTREVTQQYRLNQWTEIIRECRSSGQSVASWLVLLHQRHLYTIFNFFICRNLETVVELKFRRKFK